MESQLLGSIVGLRIATVFPLPFNFSPLVHSTGHAGEGPDLTLSKWIKRPEYPQLYLTGS
jgi:hypothetical protein